MTLKHGNQIRNLTNNPTTVQRSEDMSEQMFDTIQTVKHKPNGDVIRNRRNACQIGLRELARLIDISPSYLSKMENGQIAFVSDDVAYKIHDAIGV